MILYLAGNQFIKQSDFLLIGRGGQISPFPNINEQQILESYYYCKDNKWMPQLIPHFKEFLLDSGAFTFMQNTKAKIDWDTYLEGYADFINKNNVRLFFELDIDVLVGLEKVEEMRERLIKLTGKKPIPVWHRNRGKEYFTDMCKEYNYVALGSSMVAGVPQNVLEKTFPYFIKTAHQNGAKIHGLGYTSIEGLFKYHFDSVDSTAWLYGNRGGYLYRFNPATGRMGKVEVPKGKRLHPHNSALHNFLEWNKFQKYAEKYL